MNTTRRLFIRQTACLSVGFPLLKNTFLDPIPGLGFHHFISDTPFTYEDDQQMLIIQMEYTTKKLVIDKNLTIICKNLILNGTITAPGRKVTMIARDIICKGKSIVDTSGKSYLDPVPKAINGVGLKENKLDGQDGTHGLKGAWGDDGGLIELYANTVTGTLNLISNGGDAGNGQDGGDGVGGNIGPEGASGLSNCSTGQPGGKGGTGGAAGNGGDAGLGGLSGVIVVRFVQEQPKGIILTQKNGKNGLPGKKGNPGAGGPGGAGGINYAVSHHGGHFPEEQCNKLTTRAATGQPGNTGKEGSNGLDASKVFRPVSFGSINDFAAQKKITIDEYALQVAPYPLLGRLLLQDLEYSYIDFSYTLKEADAVAGNLRWLVSMSNSILKPNDSTKPYQQEWALTGKVAVALYDRWNIGTNYWSNGLNYVTRLKSDYLQTQIKDLFISGVTLEKFYKQYKQANRKIENQLQQFEKTKEHLGLLIDAKNHQVNDELTKIKALNEDIDQLNVVVQQQYEHLLQTEEAFRKAIESKSNCSFDQILGCIEMVVGVVLAVYSGGSSLALVADGVRRFGDEGGEPGKEHDKKVIENKAQIKQASAEVFESIKEVKKLYDFIKQQNEEQKTLISIQRGEFERLLQTYKDLTEAKPLKEEFEQYVRTIDLRNQKRLQYTECWLKMATLKEEIASTEHDIASVNLDQMSLDNTLDAAAIQAFMDRTYFNTKVSLLYLLYLEKRAIDYKYLVSDNDGTEPLLAEKDIAVLQAAHINNSTRAILKEEEAGGPADDARIIVTFVRREQPRLFAPFVEGIADGSKRKHMFLINILPNHPAFAEHPWREIFAHALEIKVQGIQTHSGNVIMKVKHFGNSTFVNVKNETITFHHRPAVLSTTYDVVHNKSIIDLIPRNLIGNAASEDVQYRGLSPFATWSVEIAEDEPGQTNAGLKITEEAEISFVFDITRRVS